MYSLLSQPNEEHNEAKSPKEEEFCSSAGLPRDWLHPLSLCNFLSFGVPDSKTHLLKNLHTQHTNRASGILYFRSAARTCSDLFSFKPIAKTRASAAVSSLDERSKEISPLIYSKTVSVIENMLKVENSQTPLNFTPTHIAQHLRNDEVASDFDLRIVCKFD